MLRVNNMAIAAGLVPSLAMCGQLERFAALVASKEREACALECENLPAPESLSVIERLLWDVATMACAEKVRGQILASEN